MPSHPVRDTLLTALLAALSFGGSCTSDNSGGYDPHPYNDGPYNGGPYRGDNGGYGGPYDRDDDRPGRLPRSADVVREGSGKLKWTADLDGTFYVYDRTKDVIRYTAPVRRGDEIIVHPDEDHVYINGRVVSDQDLKRDDIHQLYFAPARPDYNRPDRDRPDAGRHDDAPVYGTQPIPKHATRLARGTDAIAIKSLGDTGSVYVYDEDAQRILFNGTAKRGSSIQVVPRDGKIYANGETVAKVKFAKGHVISVYFVGK